MARILRGQSGGDHQPAATGGFPVDAELESKELPERSWVKVSQIRTLSVVRIGKKLGLATPKELGQVVEGLNEIIG